MNNQVNFIKTVDIDSIIKKSYSYSDTSRSKFFDILDQEDQKDEQKSSDD